MRVKSETLKQIQRSSQLISNIIPPELSSQLLGEAVQKILDSSNDTKEPVRIHRDHKSTSHIFQFVSTFT